MINYLNDINKAFYLLIGVSAGFRVVYVALQLITGTLESDVAKKKIGTSIKAAIIATVLNSLVTIIKGYYGG